MNKNRNLCILKKAHIRLHKEHGQVFRAIFRMVLFSSLVFLTLFCSIVFPLDSQCKIEDESDKEYNLVLNSIYQTESFKNKDIIEIADNLIDYLQEDTSAPQTENFLKNTEEPLSYTNEDLYYLAVAVYCEAGAESEEIQLLVANVVINRVNSPLYPDTIYGVLTDYLQYGMMWKYGVFFPESADQKTINNCYNIARRILEGERVCPENVLFQAEFVQGSGIYKQFGDSCFFCYL